MEWVERGWMCCWNKVLSGQSYGVCAVATGSGRGEWGWLLETEEGKEEELQQQSGCRAVPGCQTCFSSEPRRSVLPWAVAAVTNSLVC